MSQIGLGRVYVPDERDARFPYKAPHLTNRTSRHWWSPVLDQGPTSECCAFAAVALLMAGPLRNKWRDPHPLYKRAQQLDQWPGEAYDGTSVRGVLDALREIGLVTEYRWAQNADDVMAAILLDRPCLAGTVWKRDMFTPTRTGFLEPTGPDMGGHGYFLSGGNLLKRDKLRPHLKRGAIRKQGSWGDKWADKGRAWLALEDFDELLADYGECAIVTEIK